MVNQQVAASTREWHDAQSFLGAKVDALMIYHGTMERRCKEYYQAYITQVDEMHKLATKNITLQQEVEKAEGLTNAADRKVKELDAVSTSLAERNVSLQQDLDQAHEKMCILDRRIREVEVSSCELASGNLALQQDLCKAYERIHILESRVAGADPLSATASGSENKAHELATIDQKSPDVIITELRAKLTAMEGEYDKMVEESKSALANAFERTSVAENKLKQFEDRENCLDNRETDSTISVASKRASPSPGDGGGPKAEESKTNAKHGKRGQYRRGRGKQRKLGPTNPGLQIVCS